MHIRMFRNPRVVLLLLGAIVVALFVKVVMIVQGITSEAWWAFIIPFSITVTGVVVIDILIAHVDYGKIVGVVRSKLGHR